MKDGSLTKENLASAFRGAESKPASTRSASGKTESSARPSTETRTNGKAEKSASLGITKYTIMMPNDLVDEFEELYEKLRAEARKTSGTKLKKNEFLRGVIRHGLDEKKLRNALKVAA